MLNVNGDQDRHLRVALYARVSSDEQKEGDNIRTQVELADFVVERRVPLGDLITHTFRLDNAVEAYKLFDSGRTGKVVFVWD